MKLTLAATLLALVSTADASKVKKTLNLRNKSLSKKARKELLKNAKPYKQGRKLNDEWEVTYDYSIQFNQCVHLRTQNDDMCDEDYYAYAQAGTIQPIRSYVLFQLAAAGTEDMYVYDNLWMVDLPSYIQALTAAPIQEKENFCQQCEENDEYCGANQDERKLDQNANGGGNYINCQDCWDTGCYEEEPEDDDVVQEEDILDWVQEMAECVGIEMDNDDDAQPEYSAAFTCNEKGDGVEIGVFLGDDCTMLYNGNGVTYEQLIYNNQNQDDDNEYEAYLNSKEILTYPFLYDVSCDGTQVEYDEPPEQDEEQEAEEEGDEDNEDRRKLNDEKEVSEACQELFGADVIASLENCWGNEEQDEDDDQDEQECNMEYDYDITEDDAEEAGKVCEKILEFGGEYSTYFRYEGGDNNDGGGFYDYTPVRNDGESSSTSNSKTWWIIAIVAGVLGLGFLAFSVCGKSGGSKDSKKTRLTTSDGAMA